MPQRANNERIQSEWVDRYLDIDLREPITASLAWAVIRLLAGLVGAALLWVFNIYGWQGLSAVLVIGALAQIINAVRLTKHATLIVGFIDALTIAGALYAAPFTAVACMIWFGSITAWQAVMTPTRLAALYNAVAGVLITATAWHRGIESWWLIGFAAFVFSGLFSVFGSRARRALMSTELELLNTVTATGGVVWRTNVDTGRVTEVYGDIETLTGYSRADWLELSVDTILHPDDREQYCLPPEACVVGKRFNRSARFIKPDGDTVWIRETSQVAAHPDGTRFLRAYLANVTEIENARQTMATRARTDVLTGLPNRYAHDEYVDSLLAAGTPVGLVVADLNRFKEVNDVLGHAAGDQLLLAIGQRLSTTVHDNTHVARLGGDEFALVVVGATTVSDIEHAVAALDAACSEPCMVDGSPVRVGVSAGVALATEGVDHSLLMRHADIAMYEAKRRKTLMAVFDDELKQRSSQRLALSSRLPEAIEADEILLYYQPQVEILTGRIIGVEGLARWEHPDFGVLSAASFMDAAIVSEHFEALETRMLHQAFHQAADLAEAGVGVPISVNMSIRSMCDPSFAASVARGLHVHDLEPRAIVVEMTEEGVDHTSAVLTKNLADLHALGVRVSIDDFGTGYSSLRRVSTLDLDELKIDRSFVTDLGVDPTSEILVDTVVQLANRLSLDIIGEGVEHHEQAAALHRLGCPIAQGFLYSRAVPPDEVIPMLSATTHFQGLRAPN